MAGIELVVTDLDGTLWDAKERIHDRTLAALRQLRERRMPLLVATGRRARSAAVGLAREGLQPPAVLLDGAFGQDLATGATFHQAAFAPGDAHEVLDAFAVAGLSPCLYVVRDGADVVVGPRPSTHPRHLAYIGDWLAREDDLRRVAAIEPVLAFGVTGLPAERFRPFVRRLGGRAAATVTRDVVYGGATLMVKPPGVSKWQGVAAYCERHGLDPARVLALGDGDNDLELLTQARVSVVVRDGCEAALALADHVIDPAADGGWGAVLDLC